MGKLKIFLGGTCNETTWREELIPLLDNNKFDWFNPVVKDWTPECQKIEEQEKMGSHIHLYVITKEMKGVFSIAEAVQSSNVYNVHTIFHVVFDGFEEFQVKSLRATMNIIKNNHQIVSEGSMKDLADVLNNKLFNKE